jgi:hypothetical protein
MGGFMRRRTLIPLLLACSFAHSGQAFAETTAVIAICSKEQKVCNKDNARSIYRIPLKGTICFVPVQQKLAELGVYDETRDDIRITCEVKPPRG